MSSRRTPLQATFTREKLAISSAVAILAVLIPFIDRSQYGMDVLVTMLIIMILNVSWNFILGVASVWNFGQLAIYAVGGYGAGLIILHTSIPPVIAIIGGGLTGTALAVIISVPTLRLYGIYTSLLTFAAAEVVQLVIRTTPRNDGRQLRPADGAQPVPVAVAAVERARLVLDVPGDPDRRGRRDRAHHPHDVRPRPADAA